MNLEPGFYKIEDKRSPLGNTAYLKVFYDGKTKMFQINHRPPEKADNYGYLPLEGYRFLKKLRRPLDIETVRITIQWRDSDGDVFETSMRNVQVLRALFREFPELAKRAGANMKSIK